MLKCKIENLQSQLSGVADGIFIELVGWWGLREDNDRWTRGNLHLHGSSFSLGAGQSREIEVILIGNVSFFAISVRKLEYLDLWGHRCKAFMGAQGVNQILREHGRPSQSFGDVSPDYENRRWYGLDWQLR